jgi:hypothetical protein
VTVTDLLSIAEKDEKVRIHFVAPKTRGEIIGPRRIDLHREAQPTTFPWLRPAREKPARWLSQCAADHFAVFRFYLMRGFRGVEAKHEIIRQRSRRDRGERNKE